VVGIDINKKGVLKYSIENTAVGTIFDLPIKNESFDAVILAEVIEHLYDAQKVLREVNRVLRCGGNLYLTTPNPYLASLQKK